MPSPVDKYFEKVKKENPSYSDEQAWATAWSIYCKHKNPGSDHCHKDLDEYLKGRSAMSLERKVAARFIKANEHNPDPLTYKAFLSEFKRGTQTGQEVASAATHGEPVNLQGEISRVDDLVSLAASDLLELAQRINRAASSPNGLAVKEHRLVPKMSGILSTLFYNAGKARGLKGR